MKEDGVGIAVCGPVFMTIFFAPPTVERLNRLIVVQRKEMTRDRHVVISFIDPGVGKEMTDQARKRAKEISDEMDPYTIANCLIVLGEGFFASMVRSVVAGIMLFSRQKHPWKVFGDIDAGLKWTLERGAQAGKAVDVEATRTCVRDLLAGTSHEAIKNAS